MTPSTVPPLLLAVLRGTAGARALPALSDQEAWSRMVQEAKQHGVTGLLYRWACDQPPRSGMPLACLNQLKAHLAHQTARNLLLAEELAAILRAFRFRQVPCLPVRGPALAEAMYGDAAARPMGDLDLLVRRDRLTQVGEILNSLGFVEMDRRPGFSRNFSYTLKFIKDRHGWIIAEPHWTLAYPPFAERLDMDRVWSRCVRGRVVGVATELLSSTDLFLHLCFHLIHRGDHIPLLWFYELDRLLRLRAKDIDWEEITRVAVASGQELLLAEALGRLQARFESPLPRDLLPALRSRPVSPPSQAGLAKVERRLARMLADGSSADGLESLAMLLTIKGIGPKVRFAWALLFPSAEFMRLQYGLSGRRQVAFSYVTRLGFLLREGLKGLGSFMTTHRHI